jgi:hypothetical protein
VFAALAVLAIGVVGVIHLDLITYQFSRRKTLVFYILRSQQIVFKLIHDMRIASIQSTLDLLSGDGNNNN